MKAEQFIDVHAELAAKLVEEIKPTIPKGMGFLVLTFDYGEGGRMGYASTARREDCIKMLREFLANFEGS